METNKPYSTQGHISRLEHVAMPCSTLRRHLIAMTRLLIVVVAWRHLVELWKIFYTVTENCNCEFILIKGICSAIDEVDNHQSTTEEAIYTCIDKIK